MFPPETSTASSIIPQLMGSHNAFRAYLCFILKIETIIDDFRGWVQWERVQDKHGGHGGGKGFVVFLLYMGPLYKTLYFRGLP